MDHFSGSFGDGVGTPGGWRSQFKLASDGDSQVEPVQDIAAAAKSGRTFAIDFDVTFSELDHGSNDSVNAVNVKDRLVISVTDAEFRTNSVFHFLDIIQRRFVQRIDEMKDEFGRRTYNTH